MRLLIRTMYCRG